MDVEYRYRAIQSLVGCERLSKQSLEEQGRQFGASDRTIRRWVRRFRQGGLEALADAPRADRGRQRSLNSQLAALIRETYLQPTGPTVASVYESIRAQCEELQQPIPSYWSVWRCCRNLPAEDACRARDGNVAYLVRFDPRLSSPEIQPLPAARRRRRLRIAMIAPVPNRPFWAQVQEGVDVARFVLAEYGTDVDWIEAAATSEGSALIAAVRDAARRGFDAIGVAATTDVATDAIVDATRKGIPVATFVSDTSFGEDTGTIFYHGQEGIEAGALAGRMIVDCARDPGPVAVITGSRHMPNHEARRRGFERYVQTHSEREIIGPFETQLSTRASYEIAVRLLRGVPGLRAIYVTNALTWTVAKAVEDGGRSGKVAVIGHDLVPQTLPYLRNGTVVGAIDQDPFHEGYDTAVWLYNVLVSGVTPPVYHRYTRTDLLTPSTVQPAS